MIAKEKVKAVVVILVGPLGSRNKYEHIVDTVQSVKYYASPNTKILIQDNSAPLNLGKRLQTQFPDLLVVRAPENYGLYGGLYKSESFAFQYINEHLDPEVVVMMDSDAIFTASGLEDLAADYFRQHPKVGLVGNHLTEGEGIDWAAKKLQSQLSVVGLLRDKERHDFLHSLTEKAYRTGWKDGQHILGGIALYNPVLIEKMVASSLLNREPLRRTFLQVDHIYGLLCAACGMEMGFFNIPSHPFAVVWRGMPVSPKDVVKLGIKAFHSTRNWKDAEGEWNEDQIRQFFAARRTDRANTQDELVNS